MAIENGEYEQAIRLTDDAVLELEVDDDVLACRGVALERSGRPAAALLVYQELARRDAAGALAVDLPYRIGTCLRELGDAGAAVVAFRELLSPRTGEEAEFPVLRLEGEIEQWIDVLLQFGPLEELAAALETGRVPADLKSRMRTMVRCRALARGDYELARRWLDEEPPETQPFGSWFGRTGWSGVDRKRWGDWVNPLIELEAKLRAESEPEERARIALEIGDYWMAMRGRLTMPSLNPRWIFNSESELAELQRRKNARILGIDAEDSSEELDRRDEAWHARRAYTEAAELAQSADTRARALAGWNECVFRLAELTPYQAARAFERDDTAVSRGIYRRLTEECAGTPEAKAAVTTPSRLCWTSANGCRGCGRHGLPISIFSRR